MTNKLYKISQTKNDDYDTYDSAVVVAESKGAARLIHPSNRSGKHRYEWRYHMDEYRGVSKMGWFNEAGNEDSIPSTWADPKHVTVEYIGTASAKLKANSVLVASFNAG